MQENVYDGNGSRLKRVVHVTVCKPGTRVASEGWVMSAGVRVPVKRIQGRWFMQFVKDVSDATLAAIDGR